ncbi:NO-inducible flavohemoprotein [Aquimarina muelleri]|uniref:Flavohemoprotein n=1 Tax=Aquimarina muelleri TaxID=279356 RepID=A0A918JUI8_9FLAO|nr:NO-inducible flavohemoprotein [Aquimarina muelleri]MCX2763569.1 NO-inducible flavohemoprotein [Aquimarina muelleri]GGX14464.1 flavohemoprotein [Aquimarina muelleri]
MASKNTIEIVKSTAPVLEQHGETITKVFYRLLFENHPELKDVFNMVNQKKGTQQKALASTIFQYAVHIDKLELLGDAVEHIAQKHTSLSISKEAYPIVGKNLLAAIKEVLGDAATPEIIDAWAEAYDDLAAIFINREEDIYSSREKSIGGYRGTEKFIVIDKIKESDVITSFYLKRKDGTPVPTFLPGQYVALTIEIPNTNHKHTRNYSLSDANDKDYLRISPKKQEGNPEGIVSNYMHSNIDVGDILTLGMPSGEFVLKEVEKPIVLISGGIGVTPLLSMFKELIKKDNQKIIFLQCALNSETHAFSKEINELIKVNSKSVVVYSAPLDSDFLNSNYDYQGYLTAEILEDLNINNESDFYFCGPPPFMANTLKILKTLNVNQENINYEFFGPAEELAVVH